MGAVFEMMLQQKLLKLLKSLEIGLMSSIAKLEWNKASHQNYSGGY